MRALPVACLAVALIASRPACAAVERHRSLGLVLEVDRPNRSLVVSEQAIPGFMKAMVMTYPVHDPECLKDLEANVMIDFTVAADGESLWAEDVRVHHFVSSELQPAKVERLKLLEQILNGGPTLQPLAVGEAAPSFTFIDQKRRPVSLSECRGKVVAVSFMYTKCRVANYCLKLSNNLAALQSRFADELGSNLVLLTITFDPADDGPDVLATYAAQWKADAATWHFLTGPVAEVQRVCRLFGMNFWPDMGMITHSMRTVVIDRNGRIAANLEGNEFTPQQLGDLVQSILDRSKPRLADTTSH